MLLLIIILLYTLFFAFYLELNPGLTNIWYRIGSDGYRHICPGDLFYFIVKPFSMKELWYPEFWDLNYWIGLGFILISLHVIYILFS
jgi:hypothetical protein